MHCIMGRSGGGATKMLVLSRRLVEHGSELIRLPLAKNGQGGGGAPRITAVVYFCGIRSEPGRVCEVLIVQCVWYDWNIGSRPILVHCTHFRSADWLWRKPIPLRER